MKRLWAKKGFTLVELIVVVALIALLLAIVIPLLSSTSAYESDARDRAQAFYSNVQEAMTEEKVKETALPAATGSKTVVWAEVKGANTTENTGADGSIQSTATVTVHIGDVTAALDTEVPEATGDWAEFASTVSKLLSTTDISGNFYAVVDSKYRVESAFFVRSPLATYERIKDKGYSSECHVKFIDGSSKEQEAYMGAYPQEYWYGVPAAYKFFEYRAPTT